MKTLEEIEEKIEYLKTMGLFALGRGDTAEADKSTVLIESLQRARSVIADKNVRDGHALPILKDIERTSRKEAAEKIAFADTLKWVIGGD